MRANQIIRGEFISLMQQVGESKGFHCHIWCQGTGRISKNIIELSGSINCLIYFKVRSEKRYTWGVTNNRVEELQESGQKWFLVLLFESPSTGYLLRPEDVDRYIQNGIWPLGRGKNKNEYKVTPGKYLQYNEPFYSFDQFIGSIFES